MSTRHACAAGPSGSALSHRASAEHPERDCSFFSRGWLDLFSPYSAMRSCADKPGGDPPDQDCTDLGNGVLTF